MHTAMLPLLLLPIAAVLAAGCASPPEPTDEMTSREPPPAIRDWMARLTVEHAYDPETGFIVAKRVTPLPPLIADGPALDAAIDAARTDDRIVIAFATADRCAPCQQYKLDALNDERVIEWLGASGFVATHVEVDRSGDLADAYLGGRGIPMTYALRGDVVIAELRGQRSAEDLLQWLDALPAG